MCLSFPLFRSGVTDDKMRIHYNMFFDELKSGVYMVGIGGVSMSALALLLHERGISVCGSDCTENHFTKRLKEVGIGVSIGDGEKIEQDVVVYTGAVLDGHPQLQEAKKAGKRLLTRAELLGKIAEEYPHVISVAGCHGKTSTTAMLMHVFAQYRKATCHIGGEDLLYSNYDTTGNEYFITEACEFKRSFLSLYSDTSVILNTDFDHSDCYRTKQELLDAYGTFAAQAKRVVVNADDADARKIPHTISFGLYNGDIRAQELKDDGEKYAFTVSERGIPLIRVQLNCVGRVSVYHALAAFAVARLYGFSAEEIRFGLQNYYGVKRRFEDMGAWNGVPVICDYAHHPREISAALQTAERICKGRVQLVFQPHTYTRTRDFMDDFVYVLSQTEHPVIYKTYAARESFCSEGSAYSLVSRLPSAVYVQSPEQLQERLRAIVQPNDLILVLGAGDIYQIVEECIKKSLLG